MGTAKIIINNEDDVENAVKTADALLRTGGVIIYPTDTLYGIGGDATSEEVVGRICKIKKITEPKPFSVIMNFNMLDEYCETGVWEDAILDRYLPGPYTFLLKKRDGAILPAIRGSDKVGIRIPDNKFCEELSNRFGKPIITTSANITKNEPAAAVEEIDPSVLQQADLIVESGQTKYSAPSVVIDLVERKILREGGTNKIDILELAGQ